MAAYIAAEQRLGRVRADLDPTEAASLLLGALFAIAAMPTIEDADLDPGRLTSMVRLFVRGIQPTLPGA